MGCVCFLTGAQARPALSQVRLTQLPFLLEAVPRDCMLIVLGFKSQAAHCFLNVEAKEFSFPTSLRFLLHAFPTLRFISAHGVH